ncbi:MAG: translation initiation factor IF-2 [Chloroflexota bacterium]|nr:translation initiation factor IF-2 [Chloroflexota bacterium]
MANVESETRKVERSTKGPSSQEIQVPDSITVRDLAEEMGCSPIDLIKELMNAGVMANINQELDHDTAAIVAEDMGYTVKEPEPYEPAVEVEEEQEETVSPAPARHRVYSEEELKYVRPRPPVITMLGHVDHGKTSLLDVIRRTEVQAGEAGGITQKIGAYQVSVEGRPITFLDTPGHEAFTAMRARGANATDIAVLVVAADDGVQPQTREAIDHARAARVPIIVALNKIDLPSANPEYVMQQLADVGLVPEDWGGDTIVVPTSAMTEEGIDTLLGMILLVAEMEDLKANPQRKAEGIVIEGELDRSRGPLATLLVQEGTLRVRNVLLVGETYGRVRAMFDYRGETVDEATPSMPVRVMGLNDVPRAGDTFRVIEDRSEAKELAEERAMEREERRARPATALSLEELYAQAQAGNAATLNLILKADAQGSIAPIRNSLQDIEEEGLGLEFVHEGVGNITESDVNLAIASQAVILGFNVDVDPTAAQMANSEGIRIRTYDVIYRLIEDVQLALRGMLEPEYEEVAHGRAVVRQVFEISGVGKVAGCQVREGKALRNADVRIRRGTEVIYDGPVASLKRFQRDVREVSTGMECGVGFEGLDDLREGDTLEFYTTERVEQGL